MSFIPYNFTLLSCYNRYDDNGQMRVFDNEKFSRHLRCSSLIQIKAKKNAKLVIPTQNLVMIPGVSASAGMVFTFLSGLFPCITWKNRKTNILSGPPGLDSCTDAYVRRISQLNSRTSRNTAKFMLDPQWSFAKEMDSKIVFKPTTTLYPPPPTPPPPHPPTPPPPPPHPPHPPTPPPPPPHPPHPPTPPPPPHPPALPPPPRTPSKSLYFSTLDISSC